MTPNDDGLIDRIGQGDSQALAELMDRYGPRLMRFASQLLRSSADADEVLQDVFLRAERAIRKGVRPNRIEAWLFRITLNRCRSRRRRWWPFVSGAEADHALTSASSRADDESIAWRDEIQKALDSLTPPLREAFLLKHVEGLEYEAMAEVTGASVSALKMRVARACERLREELRGARE